MTIRYRDLLAVIARASDVGMARPEDTAERTALAAHRIATLAGHTQRHIRDAVYVSLLRYAGCTADASASASLTGNEMTMNRDIYGKVHYTEPREMLAFIWEFAGEDGRGLAARMARFAGVLSRLPGLLHTGAAHCEVNDIMAQRVGFDAEGRAALEHAYEGWNGSGMPNKLRGEAIAVPARVALIADSVVPAQRLGGAQAIAEIARRLSGRAFDPGIAQVVSENAEDLAEAVSVRSPSRALRELELAGEPDVDEAAIGSLCEAIADFADLKCVYTRGHCKSVTSLAVGAATLLRVPPAEREVLRRAALLHNVGRVGVTISIWDKPGPLDDAEWTEVRLHTMSTERVLRGSVVFGAEAELASLAHERLDGSGYHRRLPPAALSMSARILAAADVFCALCSTRPHRAAVSPSRAAEVVRGEVEAGRLAGDAVEAVIAAAGQRPRTAVAAPRGLTEREVEVLGLIANGKTNKEIAAALGIASKTAGNHVQNVLGKVGVSTRAAAAMFAMRAGLVPS